MKHLEQPPTQIDRQIIKSHIKDYTNNDKHGLKQILLDLSNADNTKEADNKLTGRCGVYSMLFAEYLTKKNIPMHRIQGDHRFLYLDNLKEGLILDPALGQFVEYHEVFLGTLEELKEIFIDTDRQFFDPMPEKKLSRKDWFNKLYVDELKKVNLIQG